jgi:hypothetical protein
MAKIAVVSAEGVLCRQDRKDNTFAAYTPIPEGLALVGALSTAYNVAVVSHETDADSIRDWMKDHGMAQFFSYAVPRKATMPEERTERILAQVEHLQSSFRIGLVVDADPRTVGILMGRGHTSLLFCEPEYARPEWRPDDGRGMRSWAEIEAEVRRQNRLKADDARAETDNFEVV